MQVLPGILSDSERSGRLMRCRPWFLWFGHGAARVQSVDFSRAEPELLENSLIVFAKGRGALCRHFSDAMHLNGTADRGGQLAARTFERNDDVIQAQLRIVDDFLWPAHGAECDVNPIE